MTARLVPIGRLDGRTYDRWRSCTGKVRHQTWQAAYTAAKKMHAKHGVQLTPYECRHCSGIHIGRRKS